MDTWFMSDTHFGHGKHKGGIIEMMSRVKPGTNELFKDIEEHDECLIDSINSVVDRHDRLVIAGDFCWGTKPGFYRDKIKCRNIDLVLGNHDLKSKCARVFSRVHDVLDLKIKCQGFTQRVVVCHYPLSFWEKSYAGSIHFYGHCHGMVEDRMNSLFPGRRSMDIGVDPIYDLTGFYKPMLAEELVCRVLERREGHDDVEFYHTYQEKRNQEKLR